MKGKLLLSLFVSCLAVTVHCNLNQRIVDMLRNTPNPENLGFFVTYSNQDSAWHAMDNQPVPCEMTSIVLQAHLHVLKVFGPIFNRLFTTHLLTQMLSIRLTKRVKILNIESWYEGFVFNTKVAAIVAEKSGGVYSVRGVDGTGTMNVFPIPLITIVNGMPSVRAWNTVRDSQLALDVLEKNTLKNMMQKAQQSTGLGQGLKMLGNSAETNRHIAESCLLRRFYSKVEYSITENDESDLQDLHGFIRQASNNQIQDGHILNRISQVSGSSGQANFLYVPHERAVFYITVWRSHAFRMEVRAFKVEGGLPTNAFVTSTGGWHIENHGSGSRVNVGHLIEEFRHSN